MTSRAEMLLAECLADLYARDTEALRSFMPEVEDLETLTDDDLESYVDGFIDAALQIDAQECKAIARPRTQLEMMVDRACGIEIHDGRVVELEPR